MKSNRKIKIFLILIILGIICAFSPIFTINLNLKSAEFDDNINLDDKNLKISALSAPIYIDDNNPSVNWSVAESLGLCTGSGNYTHPYVIEDLVIDGGGSESCIWIRNSNVYFRIENCTVYNSYDVISGDAGIRLNNVNNSRIVNNNCSNNSIGIRLVSCNNNTFSGNNASNNNWFGIILEYCNNNTLSGNRVNNNRYYGICLEDSNDNVITGNDLNNNALSIYLENSERIEMSANIIDQFALQLVGTLQMLASHDIDNTNLVNGKPIYYYTNEVNLGSSNFTNAGQVLLVNCNDSTISNLDISYCPTGIALYNCNNNTISGNTANNNDRDGIGLFGGAYNTVLGNTANYNDGAGIRISSDNNIVSGNTANNNSQGICLYGSDYNTISGNTANNNNEGIHLSYSDYNTVSENILQGNDECIVENQCEGNEFKDNEYCDYGEDDGKQPIPGYNLYFLFGILSLVAILIIKKIKKS